MVENYQFTKNMTPTLEGGDGAFNESVFLMKQLTQNISIRQDHKKMNDRQ